MVSSARMRRTFISRISPEKRAQALQTISDRADHLARLVDAYRDALIRVSPNAPEVGGKIGQLLLAPLGLHGGYAMWCDIVSGQAEDRHVAGSGL